MVWAKSINCKALGVCVNTVDGVSYADSPWCLEHICPSDHHYPAINACNNISPEHNTGTASSGTHHPDDGVAHKRLRSIVCAHYAKVEITPDMWVASSIFKV